MQNQQKNSDEQFSLKRGDSEQTSLDNKLRESMVRDIFSVPESTAENFSNQVDKWTSGKLKSSEQLELGNTPAVLEVLGAKNLPIMMSQDVLVKATGGKHNISLDEIKKLPNAIADPIMVFKSATVDNAFVVLTELVDKSGNDVVAAMHLNRYHNINKINRIASIYGKDNISGFVEKQIKSGNLKYIDKNKSQEWSVRRGLQLPKLNTILNSNNNILQKEDIVNRYIMQNQQKNSDGPYSIKLGGKSTIELIDRYGAIPKGEKAARDVSFPKQISGKKYVSRFARTAAEAGAVPNEAVSEYEKAVLDGTLTYERIGDKAAMEYAEDRIKRYGFEASLAQWNALIESGHALNKKDLALGDLLHIELINHGDATNAMKVFVDLAAERTRSAQNVQSSRLLKMLSADGQLYYIEKTVLSIY